jgi:hypothetical protein
MLRTRTPAQRHATNIVKRIPVIHHPSQINVSPAFPKLSNHLAIPDERDVETQGRGTAAGRKRRLPKQILRQIEGI